MSRPFRIVRYDPKTGRVISKSAFSWPNMTPHDLTGNAATTARESLDRKIHATLNIKKSPMPSSLAKRMDEACATDLRQLKRATFPEEPTLVLSALSRNTRFQPAFVKPAGNTAIPAEPAATVTSSTIPSYYTRSQPALAMSADNTTTTTSSTASSSTVHSRNIRFQPATRSAESTTSSIGSSTTHSRNTSVQSATRPAEIGFFTRNTSGVRVWHPAPTFTTTTSSESRSSSSVPPTPSAPVPRPSKYPPIELDPLPNGDFPRIGKTLLYDLSPATMQKTEKEDGVILKYIKKFGTAWADATLPAAARKAWNWRKRSAAYREKVRKEEEEEFKQSGLSDRSQFVSKREMEDYLSQMLQLEMPAPAPEPQPKPKAAPEPEVVEEDSTMSTIFSVMSGFTEMITATASDLYTWFSGRS